jgi:hypothetical protein
MKDKLDGVVQAIKGKAPAVVKDLDNIYFPFTPKVMELPLCSNQLDQGHTTI